MRRLAGLSLALLLSTPALAALQPPEGFRAAAPQPKGTASACPAAPTPYTGALDFPSKYEGSDRARDQLNNAAYDRYRNLTADIGALEKGFYGQVRDYLRYGRPGYVDCALSWLDTWASANALLSEQYTHTGKSRRKWVLASLTANWLRLQFSASQPLAGHDEQVARIEAWFGRLADQVRRDWQDQPLARINNHQYWAAWSLMASAVVLDRRDLYDWALDQYRIASHQVDAQGFLPNELRRRSKALAYHSYALGPLLMIEAFARANGDQLDGDALQRLGDNVIAGRQQPQRFARTAGAEQSRSELQKANNFAWLEPFCALHRCDAATQTWLQRHRPLGSYRLGGDLSSLFSTRS